MTRYPYSFAPIYRTVAISATVPFVFRLALDFSYAGLAEALQSALLFVVLMPLYLYHWELLTELELGKDALILRRRISENHQFAYRDIHRLTVRRSEGTFGWPEWEVKIAHSGGHFGLPITYLEDREGFIRRLRAATESAGSKFLYQGEGGQFLPSLEALRQEA
jgi:hypothetical protein